MGRRSHSLSAKGPLAMQRDAAADRSVQDSERTSVGNDGVAFWRDSAELGSGEARPHRRAGMGAATRL